MKKKYLALGLTLAPLISYANINGIWQTETNEEGRAAHVEIKECNDNANLICGYIKNLINSDNTEILGKVMVSNMKIVDSNTFEGGTIWAPDKDKVYDGSLTLDGDELKVKGCILGGFICRGQTWTRVE